jgi:hypothetical protein
MTIIGHLIKQREMDQCFESPMVFRAHPGKARLLDYVPAAICGR